MASVVVEYSANLKDKIHPQRLCKLIGVTIMETGEGLFPTAGIRVRAYKAKDYFIGDGDDDYAFVAINVRIAAGRAEEDKRRTFDAVFKVVKDELKEVYDKRVMSLSMDVEEFGERLAYKANRLHEKLGTKPLANVVAI